MMGLMSALILCSVQLVSLVQLSSHTTNLALDYLLTSTPGGGTVLGGCYQKHSTESQPDPNLAIRIMQRCVALCPSLTSPGNGGVPGKTGIEALSIIRHGVGLRPVREGGPRVEREKMGGVRVVHCYGHGGAGYQASYGSCYRAVRLVVESLSEGGGVSERARL